MPDSSEFFVELLVDLGGVHPLYLPLGKYEFITLPKDAVNSTLGVGLQGPLYGFVGRIRRLSIGKYTLKNVVTAFAEVNKDSGIYGNTMIGMSLLQRFNIIFNYFDNVIILESATYFDKPFEFYTGKK